MSAVELCGIGKSFAGRSVLQDVQLRIQSGDYVVLLGPSGCGKTTTLRIIAGLEKPDAGDVRLGGRDIDDTPPSRRDVSMVFQNDALYPHLTVRQCIEYGLRRRVGKADAHERIMEATSMMGIDSIVDRLPAGLSGGELRRASVAKAIARRASIRLLDEPLSAIDAMAAHRIQDDLLRWHHAHPGTTIHVTHHGGEAMRMADKIAVMDQGRIVQFDCPANIYQEPATIDVAEAVGWPPISFLGGTIRGGRLVIGDGQVDEVEVKHIEGIDRKVVVGVRPERWRIHGRNHPASRSLVIDAPLQDLRPIDNRWMATFRHQDRQITTMLSASDRRVGELVPGANHRIAADVDDLCFFDPVSEKRLTG